MHARIMVLLIYVEDKAARRNPIMTGNGAISSDAPVATYVFVLAVFVKFHHFFN
jgi:hypothetical protein